MLLTSHQAQELSEAAVKIGLLEKKVDNSSTEVWCIEVLNYISVLKYVFVTGFAVKRSLVYASRA